MGKRLDDAMSIISSAAMPEDSDAERVPRPHRRHQRDVFRSFLVDGATFAGPMDIPVMKAAHVEPEGLVPFSVVASGKNRDYDLFVDFFEDDYQIERFWNHPYKYLEILQRYAGCISPDHSTCRDFPVAQKAWNVFRNQALGSWLQRNGVVCVPNVRCEPRLPWMLDGTPRHSTIAIGARGCVKDPEDRAHFVEAVRYAVDVLGPDLILWYGSNEYEVASYPEALGIPIRYYEARFRRQG